MSRIIDEHLSEIAGEAKMTPYEFRKSVQFVQVDNVERWIRSEFGKKLPGPSAFNCVVPPWPNVWLEWKDTYEGRFGSQMAAWVRVVEDNGICLNVKITGYAAYKTNFSMFIEGNIHMNKEGSIPITIREDGSKAFLISVTVLGEGFMKAIAKTNSSEEEVDQSISTCFNEFCSVALMSFQFCHCKNVRAELEQEDFKKKNQTRHRLGQQPLIRFHHITIDPAKQMFKKQGQIVSDEHLKRALHICRGHFRHYDETAKLFGKLTGTFWIPMHLRGTESSGVVLKEYEIKKENEHHENEDFKMDKRKEKGDKK